MGPELLVAYLELEKSAEHCNDGSKEGPALVR
jgi:hypothetical protein